MQLVAACSWIQQAVLVKVSKRSGRDSGGRLPLAFVLQEGGLPHLSPPMKNQKCWSLAAFK